MKLLFRNQLIVFDFVTLLQCFGASIFNLVFIVYDRPCHKHLCGCYGDEYCHTLPTFFTVFV